MKKLYEDPTLTVHEFSFEDIITTSSDLEQGGNGLDLPGVGWGD